MMKTSNDVFMDLGSYDDQDDSLTIAEWLMLYRQKTGKTLNPQTTRKRRAMANVGRLVPPRTYLLTRAEFEKVISTPLPMCHNVIMDEGNE
jgi:hypothetical protein